MKCIIFFEQRYDEGNFNYLNEVNLIKQSNGYDIIDDLIKICNKSDNISNKSKSAQVTKSNGKIIKKIYSQFLIIFNCILFIIITFHL